jgi:hypothetical protein
VNCRHALLNQNSFLAHSTKPLSPSLNTNTRASANMSVSMQTNTSWAKTRNLARPTTTKKRWHAEDQPSPETQDNIADASFSTLLPRNLWRMHSFAHEASGFLPSPRSFGCPVAMLP